MPSIMILDIPEFGPIVRTAREAGMTIHARGDYIEAHSDEPEVTLLRSCTGVRPAVWFAALTGGLVGEFRSFNHDRLCIVAQS